MEPSRSDWYEPTWSPRAPISPARRACLVQDALPSRSFSTDVLKNGFLSGAVRSESAMGKAQRCIVRGFKAEAAANTHCHTPGSRATARCTSSHSPPASLGCARPMYDMSTDQQEAPPNKVASGCCASCPARSGTCTRQTRTRGSGKPSRSGEKAAVGCVPVSRCAAVENRRWCFRAPPMHRGRVSFVRPVDIARGLHGAALGARPCVKPRRPSPRRSMPMRVAAEDSCRY